MGNGWLIRAGDDARDVEQFIKAGVVGLGLDPGIGEEALLDTRDALIGRMVALHPDWPAGQAATLARELYRYLNTVEVDDEVILHDVERRNYLVGTVSSRPGHDPSIAGAHPYVRQVLWTRRVSRDWLSVRARHALGSMTRVFAVDDEVREELRLVSVSVDAVNELAPGPAPEHEHDLTVSAIRAEVLARAGAFVEDMLVELDALDMQALLAGVLRAMGYRSRISQEAGADGAVSFAYAGTEGGGEPSVFVELRHEPHSPADAEAVAQFIEGKHLRSRCLFLSTGGFSAEARQVAAMADVEVELVGLAELRELVLEHYDFMDMESRAMMPLRKLYWPVPD